MMMRCYSVVLMVKLHKYTSFILLLLQYNDDNDNMRLLIMLC